MLHLAELEMLRQAEVDHFQLRSSLRAAEEKILQLEVPVDDTLGMNVPHGTQHLLHQPGALPLRVVILWLLIESVKQFTADAQLLHEINLRERLVHLLEADDVGMVQLAHDVDFLPQLLEPLFRFHEAEIEALDRVLDASALVRDETDQPGNARPQDWPIVNAVVQIFDGLSERHLNVNNIALQVAFALAVFDHLVQPQHAVRLK
mmetsp:Transcript_28813/g.85014  ORF Transcript_28813/g.85014 Transcript_28813/m.85014 type:complete len:205 (-) Transcript_28813:715-1329(-)